MPCGVPALFAVTPWQQDEMGVITEYHGLVDVLGAPDFSATSALLTTHAQCATATTVVPATHVMIKPRGSSPG